MRKFDRVTDYPLEKIKAILANPGDSAIPECRLINDVGFIALSKDVDSPAAQEVLISILAKCEDHEQCWIAVRFLCILVRVNRNISTVLPAIMRFKTTDTGLAVFPSNAEIDQAIAE
jgi:hypothetical protein